MRSAAQLLLISLFLFVALLTRFALSLFVQVELQAMIHEKKAELERLNAQHDSLQRVEADQKALIEKLTNNEA